VVKAEQERPQLQPIWHKNTLLLDCDVEEPNSHIFLRPKLNGFERISIPIPKVDLDKCDFCGKCGDICRFSSIIVLKKDVIVFPELCHGCGGCNLVCPTDAIEEIGKEIGIVEKGWSGNIEFVHGKLHVGEPIVPPLIKAVKGNINSGKTVIIDAPPGTSCPVIEAVKDSDLCLLVTEPTPFGLHDLKLAVDMTRALNIPVAVILNRCNTGSKGVFDYCNSEKIEIVMEIPIDKEIARSYSEGELIVERFPNYEKKFRELAERILVNS